MGEGAQSYMEPPPQWPPRRRPQKKRVSAIPTCECGGTEIDDGYCTACGFEVPDALPDRIDKGAEWRAFNLEQREKRTRVGAPYTETIHDKGLSTIIDWTGRDYLGRRLSPEQRATAYRLKKWNRRSKVSGASERNLAYALSELTKIAYKLNLPKNVLETASVIYRRVVKKRLIRGRSIQDVGSAVVYMACRQCGVIRSLKEVGVVTNLTRKEVGRNYRFLLRKLETKVPKQEEKNYISKFAVNLGMSGAVEDIGSKIIDVARHLKLTAGKDPSGMGAAATYMAGIIADDKRTQGVIAISAGVTEVTIRNRYKELKDKLYFDIKL